MIQNVHMKKNNTQLICWSSPNDPWIRLNMNEVIKENLKVCYQGVLGDSNGIWYGGFSNNMGTNIVIDAKMKAIHDGLHYAYDRGFRKIELHTDNKKVFQAINKNAIKINAKKGVLQNIISLLNRN